MVSRWSGFWLWDLLVSSWVGLGILGTFYGVGLGL